MVRGYRVRREATNVLKGKPSVLSNFSLGLITKIKELNGMDMKASPDTMDFYSDIDGSLKKRRGIVKVHLTPTGVTSRCNGLFDFESTIIGCFGTTYYKMEEADGTWDSLTGGTGMADEISEFENYSGNLIITNWSWGYAKTMQVGGSTLTNISTTNIAGRGKHPKIYKDHLLMSDMPGYPYTFYYSEVADFDDFANGGTWPVLTHDGDTLTGWGELQNRLYAFKRWSIHQMTFRGGSPYWARTQLTFGLGTRSPRTIKNITLKNGTEVLMFLGSDRKLYQFDGYNADPVSPAFEEINGISPISMDTLNQGVLEEAHAVVDPINHRYILFVANGGTSTMTHALVFNYFTGACWPAQNQVYRSSASVLSSIGRRTLMVGDYYGMAYRYEVGNLDEVPMNNIELGTDASLLSVEGYLDDGLGIANGTHDGGDSLAYAEDASENFTTLGVRVGDLLNNKTDQDMGTTTVITSIANGAGTNARLILSGGHSFDNGDVFTVYKAAFIADNDSIYIGSKVKFDTIVIDLMQVGSATITPSIYYSSDAAGGYTALSATTHNLVDGTTGFTTSGVITFDIPSGWVVTAKDDGGNAFGDTETYYYIKIQRTANALTTTPKIVRVNIGNRIRAYHTTPRLLLAKDTLVKEAQVVISYKAVSDDNFNFYHREDYDEDWSTVETVKQGDTSGEYYLGVDWTLNTATLGPNRIVLEKVYGLDTQSEYLQFKVSDSNYTEPMVLYAYSFLGVVLAVTKQERA